MQHNRQLSGRASSRARTEAWARTAGWDDPVITIQGDQPMKFLTQACFGMLFTASLLSTPALAQTEASGPFTLSGGVDVVSDYRYRGISLSNEKVEVQPSLTQIGRASWRERVCKYG